MGEIEIRGLTVKFDGKAVLDDFSTSFRLGEISVLMGKSGVGKTTLLNVMMGLIVPDAGTVTGVPRMMSAVFQEDRLIADISAARNISLGCRKLKKQLLDHLRLVGLEGAADTAARDLSGGMARRAAVVRACMAESEIIFMDEPFASLDALTADRVIDYVLDVREGRTLIVSVHDMAHAERLGGEIKVISSKKLLSK